MILYSLLKKAIKISYLGLVPGLLMSSCGPKAQNFSILPANQGAYQGSTANNKVDVLWVVDNSGSMLPRQQTLANSFNSFASIFLAKNFDFHMAIITTDIRAIGSGGQAGLFQGAPSVITKNTANFATTFESNILVGNLGDPAAKALDALELALSSNNLAGANSGFLRRDAHLAVIFISDADDDDSATTTSNAIEFLNQLKPDIFDETTKTYKKNYTVSAVINDPNINSVNCAQPTEEGLKFESLASSTNGSIASICEADFSTGLSNISQTIVQAITEIPLSRKPQVNTISISFNGTAIPQDNNNGWTYSDKANAIYFHGSGIPEQNTAIAINYIPNDIIR